MRVSRKGQVEEALLDELYASGAILKGHFVLSSGLHSDTYVQCALLLQNPRRVFKFASALVQLIPEKIKSVVDLIVAPALGGLIIGYEVARLLDKDFVFFERFNGELTLRRGFKVESGQNVLLIEDVVTTAGSSIDVIQKVHDRGANVIFAASIIDRSEGAAEKRFKKHSCEFLSVVKLNCVTFDAANIPKELSNVPCIKPGSNNLN
ncbi:orotate phosphoribosyltransferase [Neorickettsia sennetsu]|uniref:Orotate phosphoribosyltransferase n=1 Tax=Ehrlichia sennetsu (strain ATCC VR-367 / Miyayama) TaxID=222891 RepID=Q2GDM5_EHRS3|nr:orotate phosphoribosyltransferase [Neorickettsia sennetsu]ABD46501.1 orotate phosphoribosyltransferase [Neorickettsia sennetsu str. Miyayama]